MKSEKITTDWKSRQKRWYDDACGTALALELVGERWSLLIVRELMYGGRRFGELRASLPGISANVLTQRLEGLERIGVLHRRKLPPPASVQVYELTEWGRASETAIQELGRWAVRSSLHDPTLPLSAASLMMSFRTMHDGTLVGDLDARIGFRLGADEFVGRLDRHGFDVRREDPAGADAAFHASPETMASIVYGGRPIADAEAAGALRIHGDRALAERFVRLFVLPDKLA
ncbi:winged helix-turn-helix transcriptional regulator [Stakelama saccharophila]|uniref:Winged helix-turn-helix transcriptional regulator n=1 Tax=Stakelama saccharophila TaxID=3075605 RepID=A0ABZ0BBL6_9SPHN|nr:winged helix-turn-helix transcriptional regulator [Stakelama sp. W311]WNO54466.1 winged helix-turn-helix transcriptional regulator [Stakelama sp. W311]